jgi:hypothetical protein
MINKDELIANSQKCVVKCFGDKNPDKVFFVIRQEGLGRGLFSILSAVICYLDFADRCGFIPVVDLKNFETEYNQQEEIGGTQNVFEYYFSPVSNVSLDDVYSSKCVVFSDNSYPKDYDFNVTAIPDLKNIFDKYIRIKPEIKRSLLVSGGSTDRTLGIHFRGQEMRTAISHPLPPSKKQILKSIDILMARNAYQRIFVCTEDDRLLDFIDSEYRGMVISNNHFRTQGANAYKMTPRANHKYLLGLEILVDMICLSRCDALIACSSNVAEMSRFVNNGAYSSSIFINNGLNSRYRLLANVLWNIKNIIPPMIGGFKFDDKTIVLMEASQ